RDAAPAAGSRRLRKSCLRCTRFQRQPTLSPRYRFPLFPVAASLTSKVLLQMFCAVKTCCHPERSEGSQRKISAEVRLPAELSYSAAPFESIQILTFCSASCTDTRTVSPASPSARMAAAISSSLFLAVEKSAPTPFMG